MESLGSFVLSMIITLLCLNTVSSTEGSVPECPSIKVAMKVTKISSQKLQLNIEVENIQKDREVHDLALNLHLPVGVEVLLSQSPSTNDESRWIVSLPPGESREYKILTKITAGTSGIITFGLSMYQMSLSGGRQCFQRFESEKVR